MYHPSTVLLYLSDHYTTLYIHRTFSFYGMIFISVQLQPSNKTNISRRLAPERSKTFLGKQEKNWQRLDKRLRILRFVIAFSFLFIHLFISFFLPLSAVTPTNIASLIYIPAMLYGLCITHLLLSAVLYGLYFIHLIISYTIYITGCFVFYLFAYQPCCTACASAGWPPSPWQSFTIESPTWTRKLVPEINICCLTPILSCLDSFNYIIPCPLGTC